MSDGPRVSIIGDAERWFAATLYPNRVAIAIGLIVAAILLVAVARRRGWFAAARRHPRRTVASILLVGAAAGPAAWYLGSPLFIRTSLEEPAPVGPPTASLASPAAGTAAPTLVVVEPGASTGPAASAPPRLAASRSGRFHGADEFHFGSGTATLTQVAPGSWSVRFDGFSVRNGPDLYVYVSPSAIGYVDGVIELGPLKATDGSFNMAVPAGADPSRAASVVIWCKQFSVQFAVAVLGS